MFFKDHLKIVTDAGAVLHLGWDYDTPYFLDPLNGIDVDLKTAQGVNQVGDTVEGQSVSGVSRTLDVVFWGAYALDNARAFSKKIPYFTKGTLYFGDRYFARFVLQKTPYFSSYTPDPRCELMLYSEKPYWYDLNAVSSVLGGYEKAFRFPVCYDSHIYGIKRDGTAAVLRNEGSTVTSAVPRAAVDHRAAEAFVDKTFGGSLPGFLTAFMGGRKLTAKEAEDLKRLIETYQEG